MNKLYNQGRTGDFCVLGTPDQVYRLRLTAADADPVVVEVFVDGDSVLCPPSRTRVLRNQAPVNIDGFEKGKRHELVDPRPGAANEEAPRIRSTVDLREFVFCRPRIHEMHTDRELGVIRVEFYSPREEQRPNSRRFPTVMPVDNHETLQAKKMLVPGRLATREGNAFQGPSREWLQLPGKHSVQRKGEHLYTLMVHYYPEQIRRPMPAPVADASAVPADGRAENAQQPFHAANDQNGFDEDLYMQRILEESRLLQEGEDEDYQYAIQLSLLLAGDVSQASSSSSSSSRPTGQQLAPPSASSSASASSATPGHRRPPAPPVPPRTGSEAAQPTPAPSSTSTLQRVEEVATSAAVLTESAQPAGDSQRSWRHGDRVQAFDVPRGQFWPARVEDVRPDGQVVISWSRIGHTEERIDAVPAHFIIGESLRVWGRYDTWYLGTIRATEDEGGWMRIEVGPDDHPDTIEVHWDDGDEITHWPLDRLHLLFPIECWKRPSDQHFFIGD